MRIIAILVGACLFGGAHAYAASGGGHGYPGHSVARGDHGAYGRYWREWKRQ